VVGGGEVTTARGCPSWDNSDSSEVVTAVDEGFIMTNARLRITVELKTEPAHP